MASKPFPDKRRAQWVMKYKPDPIGPWVRVVLGTDERLRTSRTPKPPQFVIDRHREFADAEYNARHGITPPKARAKGLAGYAQSYLEAFRKTHKAASAKQAERHIHNFVAWAKSKGVDTVQGVTRAHCRDYLESRVGIAGHSTLRTEVGYIGPLWSRAEEDGLIARNPWYRVKIPGKSKRSVPTFWSSEEVAKIASVCAKAWQSDLVLLLANTGLRISTALLMEWSWVRWRDNLIVIPPDAATSTEGVKTAYTCAMNRVARDILQKRHFVTKGSGDGLVFPNPYRGGGPVPYDSARAAIQRAIKKSGVPPGTAHDLRHSCGRAMERAGIPASIIQAQLGHRSAAMTRVYTDATADEAGRYLDDFGVGEITDPEPGRPGT